MSELDAGKLEALKVDELKRHLSARGVKVSAAMKKGDLVLALRQALEQEAAAAAAAQAQEEEEEEGAPQFVSSPVPRMLLARL